MSFLQRLLQVLFVVVLFGSGIVHAELRLAVPDVRSEERLREHYQVFASQLGQLVGQTIRLVALSSRKECLQLLQEGKIDLVLSGPAEYVVFAEHVAVQPIIGFRRDAYFSLLVVPADVTLRLPTDLRGKSIAFGDEGSTSSHLGVAQLLADHGLIPGKDYDFVYASPEAAVEKLARDEVQAIGLGSNQYPRIRQLMQGKNMHVIARGLDLPADILLAAPALNKPMLEKIRNAFMRDGESLKKALAASGKLGKYTNLVFLPVRDFEYNYVRAMYETIKRPRFGVFVGNE